MEKERLYLVPEPACEPVPDTTTLSFSGSDAGSGTTPLPSILNSLG